jgi:hypothetical protein
MQNTLKIKVIKKNQIKNNKARETISKDDQKQEIKREIILTVTDWINVFQQRRREETKQSFDLLITQNIQAG